MEVTCLVRPTSDCEKLQAAANPETLSRLSLHQGNLGQPESYRHALEGSEVVFHLAAALEGTPAVLFLNNVVATRQLVDLSCQCRVPRFILVSSMGVYGGHHLRPGEVLDERCPLDPEPHRRDPYSYSKVAQEQIAWQAFRHGELPLVVLRPGVIYGPGRDCLSGRVGLRLGRWLIKMGGKQELPYTHVDNCARALSLAASVSGLEAEAINIIDDDRPTANELLRRYRDVVGSVRVVSVPRFAIPWLSRLCQWYHRRSGAMLPAVLTPYKSAAMWKPVRYSNEKAKRALGWQPQVHFSDGLEQTLLSLRMRQRPQPSAN
jgi:nucleoside-diphosphate-sugar epimerase